MQNVSEWLICAYSYLISLKIGAKLSQGAPQGQGCLLHLRVSGFSVNHCFAYIVYGSFFLVIYVVKQNNTNNTVKHCQVHAQLLSRLRTAQDG